MFQEQKYIHYACSIMLCVSNINRLNILFSLLLILLFCIHQFRCKTDGCNKEPVAASRRVLVGCFMSSLVEAESNCSSFKEQR
jgi:hypothetical protein